MGRDHVLFEVATGGVPSESDVGVGGEMHDRVGAAHQLDQAFRFFEQVALHGFEGGVRRGTREVLLVSGREVVDRKYTVPHGEQRVDEVRADEPRTTRDHQLHRRTL